MAATLAAESAHQMGLVPLLWLAWRFETHPEWWWLAAAFAVSWIADTAAHFTNPWFPAAIYPMSQAAIVGTVLLSRREAQLFVLALAATGIVGVLWEGVTGPAILLQTVANLGITGIAWTLPTGRVRVMLLTAFGLGWVAWMGYLLDPEWATWISYQAIRALSVGMFCWAQLVPPPRLQLAR